MANDKDQFSLASYADRVEITNSSSPSIIGNITPTALYINTLFLILAGLFRNPSFFLIPGIFTLLYYCLGPYIKPTIFQSFKTVIKLKQLETLYSDKKRGILKNIEEVEIIKVETISAKARVVNPKISAKSVKKLNASRKKI